MSKNNEKQMYKRVSIKDIFVIFLSIVALVALVFVILNAKKTEQDKKDKLDKISQTETDKKNYYVDEALGELLINEVSNDFIELYNAGKDEIDLAGISVYVDGEKIKTISDGEKINKSGYYVISLDKKVCIDETQIVSIYNKDDVAVISMEVPVIKAGTSYSRKNDGSNAILFMKSSKGKTNNDAKKCVVDSLYFSVPAGFYKSNIELDIEAPNGATVYYTLDGSTPTEDSQVYEESLQISNKSGSLYTYAAITEVSGGFKPESLNMATVVKAFAKYKDGTTSDVITQTYFVGVGFGNDYLNIPVISLTTKAENFFDYFKGIFMPGRKYEDSLMSGEGNDANYLQDWYRNVHIEYFEPNKNKTYETDALATTIKDFAITSAQKSLIFTKRDNENTIGSSIANYLKSSTHDFEIISYKRDNNYKIRELLAESLLADTSAGVKEQTPCIVFINGEYWGGYLLNNSIDADYVRNIYGLEDEEIVFYADGNLNGDKNDSKELNNLMEELLKLDLENEDNYQKIVSNFDIQSYLDYVCANMYLANSDFGTESFVMWKTKNVSDKEYCDGKWRFIYGEMDNTMNNGAIGNLSTPSIDTWLAKGITENPMFNALIKNKTFKKQLSETMDNMINNVFSEEKVNTNIEKVRSLVEKMAIASVKRFSGAVTDEFYDAEVLKIKNFFEERGAYIRKYTDEIIK